MNLEGYLVSLLVKLAAMAAIASVMARSNTFQSMLMRETRTLPQRAALALWLAVVFGASVAVRVAGRQPAYEAADLGLEGSLIAGLLGGYVTGLLSGILISLPACSSTSTSPCRCWPASACWEVCCAISRPTPEEVWRFSPYPDLNIYRFFKEKTHHWRTGFQLIFFAAILCAEALRQGLGDLFERSGGDRSSACNRRRPEPYHSLAIAAMYATTLFAVAIPLKIWNNTRNEKKLEEQERLLVEARLAALTSQINPHFLFNTLNSVSSLIRTNPNQARVMVVKLSKVLRRLLRKHENFSPLRDELNFIEDYLSIEVVRFGEKLRFETDVAGGHTRHAGTQHDAAAAGGEFHQARLEQQGGGRHHPDSHPPHRNPAASAGGGRRGGHLRGKTGDAAGTRGNRSQQCERTAESAVRQRVSHVD